MIFLCLNSSVPTGQKRILTHRNFANTDLLTYCPTDCDLLPETLYRLINLWVKG